MSNKIDNNMPLMKGGECYLITMGRRFLVQILDVQGGSIRASFPGTNYPPEGTGVALELHDEKGYVTYHAKVVKAPAKRGEVLLLQRAESATRQYHRTSWRVPMEQMVVMREDGLTKQYTARLDNLSRGGAFIKTYAQFGYDCLVELDILLPGDIACMVPGKIVYISSDAQDQSDGPPLAYGICFDEKDASANRELVKFLHKRIIALYSDELREMYPRRRIKSR